ncbi:MAG: ERCC4 domain-containing protein [Candidatus Bilamarchaeaceae archaeon]
MTLPSVFSNYDSVRIVLDHRESEEFVDLLTELGAHVEKAQLDVGDFVCSERVVVERKTCEDFETSVIDGRLFRQLENLVHNFPRPVVIVEGKEERSNRITREALMGAYSAIVSDYGLPLIFTRDTSETAEFIFFLAKHEQRSKKHPLRIFAKRKSLTPSQSARAIVEMLPSVGPKLAKAILLHFGNIESFVKASENELAEVPGLGEKRARIIFSLIRYPYKDDEDELTEI